MRTVRYYEYSREQDGDKKYIKKLKGKAMFHKFGVDYEEFETGPGNYSTAIIELEDGTVENIPVELIKFEFPK